MADSIFIGLGINGDERHPQALVLRRANRHGLIAGATGTGKTVTLQTLAEGFSREGVPVFLADVKGDIAGMAMTGTAAAAWTIARAAEVGIEGYSFDANPVVFWDLFGEQGHPIRTTVAEMGPLLLARLMGLNETQEGVLTVAFRYADENGLAILDLKDCCNRCSRGAPTMRRSWPPNTATLRASIGRHDPAPAAPARIAGRGAFLRRARARHR